LYNLGQLELARKNLSGAEKYFRAALERTLGEAELYARLHYGLGLILNERGAREQAVKEFDQALGRDDQFAPAYFWRGMARRSLGQGERARADFEKAAELSTATNPALADQARAMVRET
jgi:tetratricopeptide (TPR) repeat protein